MSERFRDGAAGGSEVGRLRAIGERAGGFGDGLGATAFDETVGFGLAGDGRGGLLSGREVSVDAYSLASRRRAIAYGRARGQA